MCAYAFAEIRALPDVERQRVEPVEEIDAGRLREDVDRVRSELRRQARRAQHAAGGLLDRLRGEIAVQRANERPQHASIAERTVSPIDREPVAGDHAVEAVTRLAGKEPARETHGAKYPRAESALQSGERMLE